MSRRHAEKEAAVGVAILFCHYSYLGVLGRLLLKMSPEEIDGIKESLEEVV